MRYQLLQRTRDKTPCPLIWPEAVIDDRTVTGGKQQLLYRSGSEGLVLTGEEKANNMRGGRVLR